MADNPTTTPQGDGHEKKGFRKTGSADEGASLGVLTTQPKPESKPAPEGK